MNDYQMSWNTNEDLSEPAESKYLDENFMETVRPVLYQRLIRIGRNNDGGYTVPEDLMKKVSTLISYGYGNDFSFERDFLKLNTSASVVLFDNQASLPNITLEFFTSVMQRIFKAASYHHPKKNLRNLSTFIQLIYTPRLKYNKRKVVALGAVGRNEIVVDQTLPRDKKFALKIDIEGAEYACLKEIFKARNLPLVLVVEFHEISKHQEDFRELLSFLKSKFLLVNTHFNNFGQVLGGIPQIIEMTFIARLDIGNDFVPSSRIPSTIDQVNCVRKKEIVWEFNSSSIHEA